MGRLWVSDVVHVRNLAWNLRLACWVRRHGDWLTAPLVLFALLRRPGFAAGKSFVPWNLSGILDLTVAVTIGALVPLLAPNFYGATSTAPMAQLPLVLIPDIFGADIFDAALDCPVSGATSWRPNQRGSLLNSET